MSARNFPVTGLTHTISYQSFLPRVFATMVLGARPWDSIVCTTESARTVMLEWIAYLQEELGAQTGMDLCFEARLDKIPLGIDTDAFQPGDKAELRQRLGLPADDVLTLYFGRFSHYDKMDLFPLLLVFQQSLRGSKVKSSLLLAGSDGFYNYSRRVREFSAELGIADRVLVRTDVPDADVPAYYAAADLFVSPSDSLQETFGQSIVEAMASGLPVVCSDWDGYKELVVHGETGYRVPTYWMDCNHDVSDYSGVSEWITDQFLIAQSVAVDIPAMANAIARLIADEGLRRTWGANGRRRAQLLFDWRTVIAQHLDLWRTLLRSADAAPPPRPRANTWFRPDFFRTFRHYPTRIVAPDTRIAPGTARPLEYYPELRTVFRDDIFEAILRRADKVPTAGDLEIAVTTTLSIPAPSFRSHLLWLLKYGHLRADFP
jgi:glycosyltransferase involved in cell wall biosynthesis